MNEPTTLHNVIASESIKAEKAEYLLARIIICKNGAAMRLPFLLVPNAISFVLLQMCLVCAYTTLNKREQG